MKNKFSVLLLSSIIFGSFVLLGDFSIYKDELTLSNFIEWKKDKKKNKKPTYGIPDEAMRWYYEQRAYPQGFIPENWRENALRFIGQNNNSVEGTQALSWSQLGPGNIGGRIRSIVVHPTDPNIIYLGSVGGGVWKTTNGGTSWVPLKDNMENLAVCSMVLDPTNPNIAYAGTGEGYYNGDAIQGEGIFKTTDAGASWVRLSSTINSNFYFVNKLMIDQSTNVLYAATRKGLYKSTDGGSTFTAILVGTGGADVHCMDIEIAYTSPSTIYATFGLFNDAVIYRSTDGGSSFSANLGQTGQGRIEMATSVSNPLVAIASFCDLSTNGVSLMAKTTDGGDNWFTMTVPGPAFSGPNNYASTQAWYDNIIYIDPSSASTFFAGGLDFWKSTNSGTNWTQKTNWYSQAGAPQFVHADHHAVTFAPSNSNLMFLGTDGGIFKSTNKGENWTAINNNLFITQFYYGAVNPSGTIYYGGAQDNGTLKSTGTNSWSEVIGGDGGSTEVDFSNSNTVYGEYVNLCFLKSTNGGSTFVKSMNGIPVGPGQWDGTTDRTLFISPFSMDPNNSNTLVAGTYRVWRTTNNAANWSAISGDLTGDGTGSSGNKISTVIVAKGNSNVIYVGCSNGRVQVTTDAGTSWNLRNSGLPNAYCTRIATDPTTPSTAFVTFSGFTASSKVYKTTNYGVNWTNISSNLPNIPVNCIVINPSNVNNIFVGTDLGVFSTINSGGSWVQDNAGLANVCVSDLDYRASDNKLFAATHGRGMFSTLLTGGGAQTFTISYDDGTPTNGYYWPNAGQGSGNRITPTIASAKLIEMQIYFTGVGQGTANYTPIVLQYVSGAPGSSYATVPAKVASNVPGWDASDLSSYNIIVNSDFIVGLKYDGTNRPTFGYDPGNNGRAWDFDGTNWSAWNETYFMRATIQTLTSIAEIGTQIPDKFEVTQNFPNPFNPSTKFRYALPEGKNVKAIIYDLNGRQVAELVNNFQNAGTYEITWNGKNDAGVQVASGTYIYKIEAGNFTQVKKMMLLK